MAKNTTINQYKYDSTHCRVFRMKLNLKNDADIIKKLSSVPSMQGYIKQLIREDIARTYSEPKNEREEKQMKMYNIKPEYLDMWEGGDTPSNPNRIITEEDIRTFSEEWGKTIDELLEQLTPCN